MPFVHDQTQMDWPDDGSEPAPPRVDQFVYFPAAEFGGGGAPVRFDGPQSAAPEQPSQSQPVSSAEPSQRTSGGIWSFLQRLLGRPRPADAPPTLRGWLEENRERTRREWEQSWTPIRSIVIPALHQIGARRIYGRYDGGNDEGFAWFDSVELQDGQRIDLDALAQRLHDLQVHASLRSAGVQLHAGYSPRAGGSPSEREALKGCIEMLCQDWATLLLGRGFGTGEFSMFGAFTVDLETYTITDDPHADPVVQNISIGQ